jgi:hypothetical protein
MLIVATFTTLMMAPLPKDTDRWLCAHPRRVGETELVVTRSLGDGGRPLFDTIMWVPDHRGIASVRWVRQDPIASAALPWRLETNLIVTMLRLTKPARRPVWLVLRVDGRVESRRLLFRRMSDRPAHERGSLEIWAHFSTDEPGTGPVPDVAGAREIVVSAEEEGGQTLASHTLPLPGRPAIDQLVAGTVRALALDVADYPNRCAERSDPPAVPVMPLPRG